MEQKLYICIRNVHPHIDVHIHNRDIFCWVTSKPAVPVSFVLVWFAGRPAKYTKAIIHQSTEFPEKIMIYQ